MWGFSGIDWSAAPLGVLLLLGLFLDVSWTRKDGFSVRFGFKMPWRQMQLRKRPPDTPDRKYAPMNDRCEDEKEKPTRR